MPQEGNPACFLFQSCPDELRPQTHSDVDRSETEASEDESAEEEALATEQLPEAVLYPRGSYDFTQICVDSLASGPEANREFDHVRKITEN